MLILKNTIAIIVLVIIMGLFWYWCLSKMTKDIDRRFPIVATKDGRCFRLKSRFTVIIPKTQEEVWIISTIDLGGRTKKYYVLEDLLSILRDEDKQIVIKGLENVPEV